mmetsp:Transcript_10658/g.19709  ORF Transcript_10658/g.19709 Transcript_10658/m.19709 type:complete len:388 (+) Transcript_10658:1119-2282(+)
MQGVLLRSLSRGKALTKEGYLSSSSFRYLKRGSGVGGKRFSSRASDFFGVRLAVLESETEAHSNMLDIVARDSSALAKAKATEASLSPSHEQVKLFASPEEWLRQGRSEFWGEGAFNVSKYLANEVKDGQQYGNVIVFAHSMGSTQTVLYDAPDDVADGVVCVTDVQTSGKGRGGNTWTSPAGCLMFTIASSVREGRTIPLGQYLACLAVVEGVRSLPGFEELDINIKWPNDIYVNKTTKIGGILSQSTIKGNKFRVYFGIGLNVDNAEPTTCLNQLCEAKTTREAVLAAILARYQVLHAAFEVNGFPGAIQQAYERHWLHSGQEVELASEGGRKAIIQGLCVASGGSLLAKATDDGTLIELLPDGNRLDFFQGLISRKVDPSKALS